METVSLGRAPHGVRRSRQSTMVESAEALRPSRVAPRPTTCRMLPSEDVMRQKCSDCGSQPGSLNLSTGWAWTGLWLAGWG
jgi:hypothetical protein